MFKTFEEVQAKYPIGTKLNYYKEERIYKNFYASPKDLIEYRKKYLKTEVIDSETVECTWVYESYDMVDGYIYDGRYWYPAEVTWDGWVPIREEEEECQIME